MAEGQLSFANNSRHHSSSASLGSNCKYSNVRVHVCSLPSIVSRIASAIGQTSNKNASGTLTRLQRGSYTSCVLYPWAPRIAYWRWVLNKQHFNSSSIQMTHRFGKGWCICIHVCSSRPPELWGMVRIDTSIICISTVPKYSIVNSPHCFLFVSEHMTGHMSFDFRLEARLLVGLAIQVIEIRLIVRCRGWWSKE